MADIVKVVSGNPDVNVIVAGDAVMVQKASNQTGASSTELLLTPVPMSTIRASTQVALTGADAPTLVIPIVSGTYVLTKGSAGAYTLAAPTAAQAGTVLNVVAGTAFAHTITATGLLDDGVTGGSKTTATFAAFVGATIVLEAYNLKWITRSLKAVTVA